MGEQKVKFEGYSILRLEIKKNDKEIKKEDGELNIETEQYRDVKNDNLYKLVMKLATVSKEKIINLDIEGYFNFDDSIEQDDIDMFLSMNAVSILYPYCRTIISNVTGLDSNQNILLPIINFASTKFNK